VFILVNKSSIRITAPEIASLWTQFQNESLASCVIKYLIAKTEDDSFRQILSFSLSLSQKHITFIKNTFESENFAIPEGFTNSDVDVAAPKLFGDCFSLHYLNNMSRLGIAAHGLSLCIATRSDIRGFYKQNLAESVELNEKVVGTMLEAGVYIRPPSIPPSASVHYATKQGFLGNLFKETRPLTSIEIMNLFINIQTNIIGKAMMTGFSQVASSPKIRDYFLRGKNIAQKHIDVFSDKLAKDDLTGTLVIEPLITDSTQSPFSDKLMLFHTAALVQAGIGNYGAAISTSQRYDIIVDYTRLMGEVGIFAEDGANLLIENGWFEEPPQAVDRKALAMS
jgi:hypothetical protein